MRAGRRGASDKAPSELTQFYTVEYVAEVLNLGVTTVWELVNAREIPSVKLFTPAHNSRRTPHSDVCNCPRRVPKAGLEAYVRRINEQWVEDEVKEEDLPAAVRRDWPVHPDLVDTRKRKESAAA